MNRWLQATLTNSQPIHLGVAHPVTCGRSLQQNTVRDATQHGNTHFKGGGGGVHGEGGVMRFFFLQKLQISTAACVNKIK